MDFDFKKVGLFVLALSLTLIFLFYASDFVGNTSAEVTPADSTAVSIDTLSVDSLNLEAE